MELIWGVSSRLVCTLDRQRERERERVYSILVIFSRSSFGMSVPGWSVLCVCVCVFYFILVIFSRLIPLIVISIEKENKMPASLAAQLVKNPPAMQEALVQFLVQKDPLEKEMATCSSILA